MSTSSRAWGDGEPALSYGAMGARRSTRPAPGPEPRAGIGELPREPPASSGQRAGRADTRARLAPCRIAR